MSDAIYIALIGTIGLTVLALALFSRRGESEAASKWRYIAIGVGFLSIAVITLFRFGALGALLGGGCGG